MMSSSLFHAITSLFYAFSILFSVKYLYDLKFGKKMVLEFLFLGLFVYVFYDFNAFSYFRELFVFVSVVILLCFGNDVKFSNAVLFSYVVVFKIVFHFPLEGLYTIMGLPCLDVSMVETSFLSLILYSFTTFSLSLLYLLGSYTLKRTLDVNRDGLRSVYVIISFMMVVLIYLLSMLMSYVDDVFVEHFNDMKPGVVMLLSSFEFVFIPFLVSGLLKEIYIEDLKTELLEEELDEIDSVRVLMYRYSHNLNSLLLTVDLLLKENNKKKLIQYLDRSKKK